jgi:hypothetical protein
VRTKPGHGPPYSGVRFIFIPILLCAKPKCMPNRPAEYLLTREAVHVFMIQSSLLVPAWLFVGGASMALTASTLTPRAGEWWPRRRGSSQIAGVWRDSVRQASHALSPTPNPQASPQAAAAVVLLPSQAHSAITSGKIICILILCQYQLLNTD